MRIKVFDLFTKDENEWVVLQELVPRLRRIGGRKTTREIKIYLVEVVVSTH